MRCTALSRVTAAAARCSAVTHVTCVTSRASRHVRHVTSVTSRALGASCSGGTSRESGDRASRTRDLHTTRHARAQPVLWSEQHRISQKYLQNNAHPNGSGFNVLLEAAAALTLPTSQ